MTDNVGSTADPPPAGSTGGSFAPLRQPVFAALWAATVIGNTGGFMRDVASAWLATDLSTSPAAVALVQAAGTLPVFLLAIPAGVLSDILDRRKYLIGIQLALVFVCLALMGLAYTGNLTIELLLALTFLGGAGAALMMPTWQSIVPELVPFRDLRSAVALNSLGVNIARSVGPAAGGLLLASFGAALTYGFNLLSYGFVIAVLLWWPRPARPENPLQERFLGAFRAGIRYARANRQLQVILFRSGCYFAFASSTWALLPLVAKGVLHAGAGFYGVLLGAVGAGAIVGALMMPRLRQRFDADWLLLFSALVTAAVMAIVSIGPSKWLALLLLVCLGGAWIFALTTLGGAAQAILPNWVRGRALAIYLMVFNGAMALGSIVCGLVAQALGVQATLLIAAGGLCVSGIALHRIKLPAGDVDLIPSNHWPEPMVTTPIEHDRGPVLILIDYRIQARNRAAFMRAVQALSGERLRDGAYSWGVTEDVADPEQITEWFMVESWAEHLRQHQRVMRIDADVQREVLQFHVGPEAPRVRHLLAVDARRGE